MRRVTIFIAVAVSVITAPAMAASSYAFDIPTQRLDSALIALGGQAHISIGGIDAYIGGVRSKAVRGRMPVRRALIIMLRDTGFTFHQIDASTVRILRALPKAIAPVKNPSPKARPKPAQAPLSVFPIPDEAPNLQPPDIIVTATKQNQELDSYAGTAHVLEIGGVGLSENRGTATFVARIPSLTSTNLGPGRNKLFVRGIADSSFYGPTQSTVGLYLGDLRLTYNAPEPNLRLYDVERIEVIEGPQGTLYGAGTLGGVIRVIPNMAKVSEFHASASAGLSVTKTGGSSHDLSGMVNLPIIDDRVALRFVGYQQIEGGYINNETLATRHTNRTRIFGGRANLRVRLGKDWTIDLSAVSQNIDSRDGQYADRSLAPLTHAANIAQPHDNDFKAANLDVMKDWDRLKLVSSTSIVKHDLTDVFDATGYLGQTGVLAYKSRSRIRLITHETRLSHNSDSGTSWVAGISMVRNVDRIERTLGPVNTPVMLTALHDETMEIALFGEATRPIAPRISATLGARYVSVATTGELIGGNGPVFEPRRKQRRFLPTAALSWKPRDDFITFLRYQSGFRSGGIAVSGGQLDSAQRFEADSIHTAEVGARFGGGVGQSTKCLAGGITGFYSIWNNIQADLINTSGLPFTDNIGRGTIYGIEANAQWRITDQLTFDGALFLNRSALVNPAPSFTEADERPLPNVAKVGGRVSIRLQKPLTDALTLNVDGTVRYVGASALGTTAPLILEQGETVQADLSLALDAGPLTITLDATNLINATGNSFSYGNPFTVANGKQTTPLRPRTFRLGAKIAF